MIELTRNRIWDDIVLKNPRITFTKDDVTFSLPRPSGAKNHNTTITMAGVMSKGYYGSYDFYYNRVDWLKYQLSYGIQELTSLIERTFTWQDMVDSVNILENDFTLTQDDFDFDLSQPIPTKDRIVNNTLTMEISKNSYYYWGELKIKLVSNKFKTVDTPILKG